MTVKEFSEIVEGKIEVKSGYNGKILCKNFDKNKHIEISEREIIKIWSEIHLIKNNGFNNIAIPIICLYVHGSKEYEENNNEK